MKIWHYNNNKKDYHSAEECEVAIICVGRGKCSQRVTERNCVPCWLKTVRQDDHACSSMQLNSSSPRTKGTCHFDAGQKLSFCLWTPSQSVSSGLRQTARAGVRAHLSLSCRSILWSLDWGFAAAFWTDAVLGVADPAQPHGFVPSDMNRSQRMKRRAYFPLLPSSLARLRSGWHWKWSRRNCFEAKPCIRKTSRSRYSKQKLEK